MAKIRHDFLEDDDPIFDQEITVRFTESRMRLGTEEDLIRDFGSSGPLLGSPVRPNGRHEELALERLAVTELEDQADAEETHS